MQLHEKINLTSFPIELGFCLDKEGREVAVALLKVTHTFATNGRVQLVTGEASVPVFRGDVPWGDPARSSLRYASDVVPTKVGTDIAINAQAYGWQRTSVQAGFRIGALQKAVLVFGPRCWVAANQAMTEPRPFDAVPVRYERAYGGTYQDPAGKPVAYSYNPLGIGFAEEIKDGAPAPDLENPVARIQSIRDRPPPAALGFLPTGWMPRAQFAGTFDAAWRESRRPLFPADFDNRFYNAVPPDQVLMPRLVGGERVELVNLHRAAGKVGFEVPKIEFSARFHVKERVEEVPMVPDTVLIEPDEERFAITFRSSYVLNDDFRFLKSVVFRQVHNSPAAGRR